MTMIQSAGTRDERASVLPFRYQTPLLAAYLPFPAASLNFQFSIESSRFETFVSFLQTLLLSPLFHGYYHRQQK